MIAAWFDAFRKFSVAAVQQIGPEKYTEEELGKIEYHRVVDGGGLFSSVKTEVRIGDVTYLIEGVLNGVRSDAIATLRHWPKIDPNGLMYLIINGERYRVSK